MIVDLWSEILRFWDLWSEILRFWDSEIQRFWDSEIWDSEILRFWDSEILRFWDLRFWYLRSESLRDQQIGSWDSCCELGIKDFFDLVLRQIVMKITLSRPVLIENSITKKPGGMKKSRSLMINSDVTLLWDKCLFPFSPFLPFFRKGISFLRPSF